jgi:acetyltransferase-like isoleucine patch superfamily enzyme
MIFRDKGGGDVELADDAQLFHDSAILTGAGGSVRIGPRAMIQPRCQLSAYFERIVIGNNVQIAPNCALYPYDHGINLDMSIRAQPLVSKGPIVVDDEAWLGFGVIVLSGVRIGKGAVVGAGSVVVSDIPDNAIAVGNPARVVSYRKAADLRTVAP